MTEQKEKPKTAQGGAWQMFLAQRERAYQDFLEKLKYRGKEKNHFGIDELQRDLLKDCYKIPFAYIECACSGQPSDHNEKDYFDVRWDGKREGPQGYLILDLFKEHPLAREFHLALSKVEGNSHQKSSNHPDGRDEGFFSHIYRSWNTFYVPEDVRGARDFTYLPIIWSNFHREVLDFIKEYPEMGRFGARA